MKHLKAMYKMRQATEQLRRAKINALRAEQGLPPIMPWYTDCYLNCRTWALETCFSAFCPCCISDDAARGRICTGKTCLSRMFIGGTHENEMMNGCLGFFLGALLAFIWFPLMVVQLGYDAGVSLVICIILGALLTLGLAFSLPVRCITLLTLPGLVSSTGRNILIGVALILALSGPLHNFNKNVQVMANSTTCAQQLAYNASQAMFDTAVAPLRGIIDNIQAALDGIINLSAVMEAAFQAVQDLFAEILAAVGRVYDWLGDLVDVCNDRMMGPYDRCREAFEEANQACRDFISVDVFDRLCNIVGWFDGLCNLARIGSLLCLVTQIIADFAAEHISADFTLSDLEEMFYFNATLTYRYSLEMNASRTWEEIHEDIQAEIQDRISSLDWLGDWAHVGVILAMLWLVIKGWLYKHRYMTKDRFDNQYITKAIFLLDDKRADKGIETIMPLNWRESDKYITPSSWRLAKGELRKLLIGLVFLGISIFNCGFYMLLDFGLYFLLDLIRRHASINIVNAVPSHLQLHVEGEGVLSDVYRALITQFDPMDQSASSLDTRPCVPHPSYPDLETYKTIAFILLVCIVLVLLESYGLRVRHAVAGCYFPTRQKERAIWLYNHILRTRGGFLKFIRRRLRDKKATEDESNRVSFLQHLCALFPRLGKLLRSFGLHKDTYCLSCGISETGKVLSKAPFIHCENNNCNAAYCEQCFDDIQNICSVCMNPVEYGDYSDMDEELDSSDDEKPVSLTHEEKLQEIWGQYGVTLPTNQTHGKAAPTVESRPLSQHYSTTRRLGALSKSQLSNIVPSLAELRYSSHSDGILKHHSAVAGSTLDHLPDHSIARLAVEESSRLLGDIGPTGSSMGSRLSLQQSSSFRRPVQLASMATFDESDSDDNVSEDTLSIGDWESSDNENEVITSEDQLLLSQVPISRW